MEVIVSQILLKTRFLIEGLPVCCCGDGGGRS